MDNEINNNLLPLYWNLLLVLLLYRRIRLRRNSRIWVHEMNLSRRESSVMNRFYQLKQHPDRFFEQFRMSPTTFNHLLTNIRPKIQRQDTQMRAAIDPETRLCVTLHFLATGIGFRTLAYLYALGRKTVSDIIFDTCDALWTTLSPVHLKVPSSHQEWQQIASGFYETWNFPNCVGAVDGKHIHIRAPDKSGTVYFNYKKTFSIVLMAVAGPDYRFTSIDVGQIGSASDGGVWEGSMFGNAWRTGRVNIPPPCNLPGTQEEMPYVMVADEAFPLQTNLLRPFPGRDLNTMDRRRYNYRLSRARRVVENAFGILTNRWRVLFQAVDADAEKASKIVKATCVLHNMLCALGDRAYIPPGFADQVLGAGDLAHGFWRNEQQLEGMAAVPRGHAAAATAVRNRFANWFSAEGAVDWQDRHITRH